MFQELKGVEIGLAVMVATSASHSDDVKVGDDGSGMSRAIV